MLQRKLGSGLSCQEGEFRGVGGGLLEEEKGAGHHFRSFKIPDFGKEAGA